MYTSRLGNGNGNGNGNGETISTVERAAVPCATYIPDWAGGDLNSTIGKWTEAKLKAPPYNITNWMVLENALAKECRMGWPMWQDVQFQRKVSALVPTAQETAEAFVEELTTLAPAPPTTGPTVITPPDALVSQPPPALVSFPPTSATPSAAPESLMDKYAAEQAAASGAPSYWAQAVQGTMPVDSRPPAAPPPQAIQAEFPLMRQYEEQIDATAADVTPPGELPAPPAKKGAGIGTVLLLAAPVLLSQIL